MFYYICHLCGCEIQRKRRSSGTSVFCSYSCSNKHKSQSTKGVPLKMNKIKAETSCVVCGSKMLIAQWMLGKYKTCSKECLDIWKKTFRGEKHSNWKGGHVETKCAQCSNHIVVPQYRIKHSKTGNVFCNPQCQYDWMSDKQTRENAPAWKGGNPQPKYPSKFNGRIKTQIRGRDGDTCKGCGRTGEEERSVLGKNLCIHHIDYNRDNLDLNNLITVCTSCNVKANTRSEREQWMIHYRTLLTSLNSRDYN